MKGLRPRTDHRWTGVPGPPDVISILVTIGVPSVPGHVSPPPTQ